MSSQWSFYKIVLFSDKCNDPRLKIPQKIVEEYESEVGDPVSLTVPTGGIWKVGLEKKADKTVWLHGDGLILFLQNNSIKFGYFLLFKYGGNNSNFNVQIFDWSAMEIQNYHSNPSLKDDSTARNPPSSFKVTMKLRHVKKGLIVRVPSSFSCMHLLQRLNAIKIVDANETNEWTVGLLHNIYGTSISRGWASFVHAMDLKVRDICSFELLKPPNQELKFRVDVLRANVN